MDIKPIQSGMPLANNAAMQRLMQQKPTAEAGKLAEAKKLKELANDFESVMVHKLMQEMQNSIPESGLFNDSATKQYQSMFWMFLSKQVSGQGGIGLADQLYKDFCKHADIDPEATKPTMESLQ